ncbi:MAG: 3-deoxy-manno-octulosonate cytidylyltransferase [Sphingobium sp.]
MNAVILIPARFASSRYPGKPLAELTLPSGGRKSLIRMSSEAACAVEGVSAVYVATDDARIADHCTDFGASVIMTDEACRNGTERCADALVRAGLDADIIVNFQGDAPLTPPWFVEALIETMRADPGIAVATPVLQCDPETYAHFVKDRRAGRVGGTTAVFDVQGDALYFSKEVLPWLDPAKLEGPPPVWHHVGVYAYRPDALAAYMALPVGRLEALEGLEQLRFLEHGHKVRCVEMDARGRVFWELNNPEDIPRIEQALRDMAAGEMA